MMHFDKDYEREISLRDLFFHILYKWRSILAAALIGAILLGGYTYFGNRSKTSKEASSITVEDDGSLTGDLRQDSTDASDRIYRQLLQEMTNYCNDSVVMQVDPYAVWKATAVYSVISGDAESLAARIAATYPSLICESINMEQLKKIYGDIDPQYIREAVIAEYIPETGSFTVKTIGLTEKMAIESLAYFDDMVGKISQADIQRNGAHTVVRISGETTQSFDSDVLARQMDTLKNMTAYYKTVFADDKASGGTVSGQTKRAGAQKSRIIRFVIIGFVAGAVFMICLYGVLYLLRGKLRKSGEITDQFGVPVFGQLNHSRARHSGKGLDGLIEKWEFRKTKTDREVVLDSASALIRERGGESGVLLTGTLSAEKIQGTANSLKELLGYSVQLAVEGAFLKNSQVVAEAAGLGSTATREVFGVEIKHSMRRKRMKFAG